MGPIEFLSDGISTKYNKDHNCYFKIEVSNGKKVLITFREFNVGEGVDYGITTLYPSYKLDKNTGEFYLEWNLSIWIVPIYPWFLLAGSVYFANYVNVNYSVKCSTFRPLHLLNPFQNSTACWNDISEIVIWWLIFFLRK